VVYCHSKANCEHIAWELSCPYYHADVIDRADTLQQWLASDGGLIVATSALGTGVDFPGIVFILHVGMPWSAIDFAQESGRGGREGETVGSIVLADRLSVRRTLEQKPDDVNVQAMGDFLLATGCRRAQLSEFLDGRAIECSELESAANCDRCGEGVAECQNKQATTSREWQ
ncbi:P-loop containing nucleoside triphosphate hydrolase protein, partial [Ophiobolus disseminans]